MTTYDVLFIADHYVMVTTIEMMASPDKRDIERAALERLAAEYGADFANQIKEYTKQVSIEEVPGTSADEFNDLDAATVADMSKPGE